MFFARKLFRQLQEYCLTNGSAENGNENVIN